jgi:hypothetical protein
LSAGAAPSAASAAPTSAPKLSSRRSSDLAASKKARYLDQTPLAVCVRACVRVRACVCVCVCARARAHGMGTVWPFAEAYLLTPAVCGGRAGASTV